VVFVWPGDPQVELIVKSSDPDVAIRALTARKLEKAAKELEELSMKVQIQEVQFKLTDKGKWKFTYLLTKDGKVLGRKTLFNKGDKRFEILTGGKMNRL
jgi:hypothetical protein